MIDGIAGNAFSATTLPPENLGDTENNAEKIIRVSRERYATKRSIVEDRINSKEKSSSVVGQFEMKKKDNTVKSNNRKETNY